VLKTQIRKDRKERRLERHSRGKRKEWQEDVKRTADSDESMYRI
jgi:hypothetical protein